MKTQSKSIRPPEGTVPLLIAAEKHGLTKKQAKDILLAIPQSFVKVGHKFFVNDFGDNLLGIRKPIENQWQSSKSENLMPDDDEPINEQALDVPQTEDVPQVLNATQRLFEGEETAIVKRCRMPNRTMLIVEYRGREVICRCKDSSMFIPGMRIIIRMDGYTLVSKYQPRKLGRY
jgi:hypothetical protein